MTNQDIIALFSLLIAFAGIITGFILQRDAKKIRELEGMNKKYRSMLQKALSAIKGYQEIEKEYADMEGMDVQSYRRKIRKDKQEFFNSAFLYPGTINEMIKELENS